jgi:glutamate/tyrosine decarboxylase-like PLP-dependent enzyme
MLDPSTDEIRDWGNSVIQLMADYLGNLRDRRVYRHMSSREIRDRLDAALPTKGVDFDGLLKVFRETIIPFSRQNAHPRMFGYVQSSGIPVAAFADLLASTLNANLTVWRSAPAPVEMERLTIDWIRQILGFNAEAGGLFVSRGSMANLAAIAAARQAKDDSSGRLPSMHRARRIFPSPRQQRFWESDGRMCAMSLSTSASESGWTISLQKSLLTWKRAMFHSASLRMPER